MTELSNLHGRLLEYLIVKNLIMLNTQIKLSKRAKADQLRDSSKESKVQSDFLYNLNCAAMKIINDWILQKVLPIQIKGVDRLPDQNSSDITDIQLITETKKINLSIKHNHSALRHQRPRTTPQHCGFIKQSIESKCFVEQYQKIGDNFMSGINNCQQFKQLPKGYVESNLYIPICELVSNFIKTHSLICSNFFFRYLIGDVNYYKIIVDSGAKEIQIQEFESNSIKSPSDLVTRHEKQYVYLNFDNNWKIEMRLHTASSRITKSPSLKFDTKLLSSSVPHEVLIYD